MSEMDPLDRAHAQIRELEQEISALHDEIGAAQRKSTETLRRLAALIIALGHKDGAAFKLDVSKRVDDLKIENYIVRVAVLPDRYVMAVLPGAAAKDFGVDIDPKFFKPKST